VPPTTPTPLRRQLAGEPRGRRPSALDAFLAARKRFLAGERVDMTALAGQLGVNRVTLYRWVGSREQLLVEVVWTLARRTLSQAEAEVEAPPGPDRIAGIVTRFLEIVIADRGMQRWLAEEGEHAMRLLTRHDHDFQPRLIAAMDELLVRERLDLPVELSEVAYVIVRLIESYTYLDLITGEQPDAQRAEPILRLLLR
jgi:AcrR family transcriptional regulator